MINCGLDSFLENEPAVDHVCALQGAWGGGLLSKLKIILMTKAIYFEIHLITNWDSVQMGHIHVHFRGVMYLASPRLFLILSFRRADCQTDQSC